MAQTVFIAVPTAYEDLTEAVEAVRPYASDMRVKNHIVNLDSLAVTLVQVMMGNLAGDACCDLDFQGAVMDVRDTLAAFKQTSLR